MVLIQCFVSLVSFLHIPILCSKSFFDSAQSVSQKLAPILVPDFTACVISGLTISFLEIFLAKSIMFSLNLAVLSSKSYFF